MKIKGVNIVHTHHKSLARIPLTLFLNGEAGPIAHDSEITCRQSLPVSGSLHVPVCRHSEATAAHVVY